MAAASSQSNGISSAWVERHMNHCKMLRWTVPHKPFLLLLHHVLTHSRTRGH